MKKILVRLLIGAGVLSGMGILVVGYLLLTPPPTRERDGLPESTMGERPSSWSTRRFPVTRRR
jgi:hypothetical protein